jgi:hypothetical protein
MIALLPNELFRLLSPVAQAVLETWSTRAFSLLAILITPLDSRMSASSYCLADSLS